MKKRHLLTPRRIDRLIRGAASVALLCQAQAALAVDCAARLSSAVQTELSRSFDEFDQDPSKGWRALASAGCPDEAAILIDRYLARQESNLRLLRWHRAQMLAMAGKYPEAIDMARLSSNPREAEQHPGFKWNAYVLATIAFLENNLPALVENRRLLEKGMLEEPMNGANLEKVKGLEKCFGQPYQVAYDCEADR